MTSTQSGLHEIVSIDLSDGFALLAFIIVLAVAAVLTAAIYVFINPRQKGGPEQSNTNVTPTDSLSIVSSSSAVQHFFSANLCPVEPNWGKSAIDILYCTQTPLLGGSTYAVLASVYEDTKGEVVDGRPSKTTGRQWLQKATAKSYWIDRIHSG